MNDAELTCAAERVGSLLKARGHRLATAESCTGGWVAQCVTDIAGSSDWFDRGFVTYSNAAKHEMLAVPERTLAQSGAVSADTVLAMVEGALEHSQAHCALAISGIAGPGGGTEAKPVGTVWIAWQTRGGAGRAQQFLFAGDRRAVRRQAVLAALNGIITSYGE